MLLCLLIFTFIVLTGTVAGQSSTNFPTRVAAGAGLENGTPLDDIEDLVLTEINRWRLSRNLVPFARHSVLDQLAENQAQYVMAFRWFTDGMDFHQDAYGGGVVNRLSSAGWPSYEIDNHIIGGENAAFYVTVDGAINFWKGSRRHRENVENNTYREIGVAAYAFRNNILVYTVFASRPNTIPIVVDADRGWAYISLDNSYYADGFSPTYIGFYNDAGQRLHDQPWLVWSPRIRLPAGITENFVTLLTDGITTVRTDVDLNMSLLFPAETSPEDLQRVYSGEPVPTLIALEPLPTLPYEPTATPRGDDYQIVMTYSSDSFFMRNNSGEFLDVRPLSIRGNDRTVTTQYLARYSSIPVSTLPPNACLQAYSLALEKSLPPAPRTCATVLSVRSAVRPSERFWLTPMFEVYWNEDKIASCYAQDLTCSFDLPANSQE